MKGIELPINILIIIVIAVIVLIALVAMFYPAFSSGSSTVNLEQAKSQACRSLVEGQKCIVPSGGLVAEITQLKKIMVDNYDVDNDGDINDPADDQLMALCALKYQINTPSDCRKLCGCPA